ncbi:MAG: hypothetical protein R3E94_02635 [Burkholderiaceae bacterium]
MKHVHRTVTLASLLLAGLVFSACGERPQDMQGQGIKSDAASYMGVGQSPFVQGNWKQGDRASWEQQLKSRAQYSQNDYARMGN